MVGVSLLIDVNEASLGPSASRGVNALTRVVISQVVDTGNTLELSHLLAGLGVHDNQHRRIASSTEKPMMGLIERQRYNTRNPRHGPGCHLFALLSIDHTKVGDSGKRHENSRPRFLYLDATGVDIRLDVPNMFIGARIL
jgi:hypothetical protein